MGKRIRLGFIYLWDSSWLGGMYYAQNLLKALNSLPDEKKPIVDVHCLSDETFLDLQNRTQYPYLEKFLVRRIFWKRVYRKILSLFSCKIDDIDVININDQDDVVFPWFAGRNSQRFVMWKPDFQEKNLPEYFSKSEIRKRDREIREACLRNIPIVFSSTDSLCDFKKFYAEYCDSKAYVVHFAASLPDFSAVSINDLRLKYGINKRYLFCANQFWKHKNHLFLFKSFKRALSAGLDVQLVCTGKLLDFRTPEYINELMNYISTNHLQNDILILGMIDKLELFCLMKHSYAVIQPSLFEGWNTTVEDCKAMNKYIFLSDLNVHREQINKNVCFFNPRNEDDLVQKLLTVNPTEDYFDYSNCVRQFGEDFLKVIESRMK
jgi:glycosyltransferase involved in cell wall biosynthesis